MDNPHERLQALRLLGSRLDRNVEAYALTMAEFIEDPDCATRVIHELTDLLAHHIERGGDRDRWVLWVTRKTAELLDAVTGSDDD
jgi:hypothetical protein